MRVGILGGGQLGRMLGEAGLPWGVRCVFLEGASSPSAAAVGPVIDAPYEDPEALQALAAQVDVVTWEFENVPVDAARLLQQHVRVHPSPEGLEVAQDRWVEKQFFREHGIETAPFARVDSLDDLRAAVAEVGLPAILKTRRFGYDGKGQARLNTPADVEPAWERLRRGGACILEGRVDFERELSVLAVRARDGEVRCWPLVENHHEDGILRTSLAPAPDLDPALQQLAESHAARVLEALGYVGVLAIEWFQIGDHLLANEMAPRVHNSGHWSIEGAVTSQFDNHLRAVLGLPLGSVEVPLPCACVNVLGDHPDLAELLVIPGVRLHDYDKAARPGRKLGHVTVLGSDRATVAERLARVRAVLDQAGGA